MAEVIGMTSGVLALTVFAFQSSKTLYQVFHGFQHHGSKVQQLKDELQALTGVLESLHATLEAATIDMSSLKLPLLRCGKACQEFAEIVQKCTAHSKGPRTSFRDWIKLNYMGKDVAGFTTLMTSYKATIMIALGDANIRTSKVTAALLSEYKALINATTFDLQEILQDTDARMRDPKFVLTSLDQLNEQGADVDEERESIRQCLQICVEVSSHIDQVQGKCLAGSDLSLSEDKAATPSGGSSLAHLITSKSLSDCKRGIGYTTAQLHARLQDANRRLVAFNSETEAGEPNTSPHDMKEVIDSVKQCLSICDDAAEQASRERVNVFEDVSMEDDGHQLIISTIGDLISAKRITVGSRSSQWLGQMSDASLQQLSKIRGHETLVEGGDLGVEGLCFENRYGTGRKLKGN